jgi:hypothetical protein
MRTRTPAKLLLPLSLFVVGTTVGACVSPPRAVGPTTLAGPLPAPQEGARAPAARAPGATDGPLLVRDPHFTWTHASGTEATYAWSCTVENPADEGFRVTLVVHLLDANGRRLAATNQSFQIGANATVPAAGDGLLEAEQSAAVASWRLEYWVETNPRPIRDS